MAEASYRRVETLKTRCPHCNYPVTLMYHATNQTKKPMFYICWMCETIMEAGKGEVKAE